MLMRLRTSFFRYVLYLNLISFTAVYKNDLYISADKKICADEKVEASAILISSALALLENTSPISTRLTLQYYKL